MLLNRFGHQVNIFTDIKYVIQENFFDKDSFLVNDKFWSYLDEENKLAIADVTSAIGMRNTRKRLEFLNKKKVFHDIPFTRGVCYKSSLYNPTKKSLNILHTMIQNSRGANQNEAVRAIEVCQEGLKNLEINRKYFEDAYQNNDPKVMLLYQNVFSLIVVMTTYIYYNCFKINDDCTFSYVDPSKNLFNKTLPLKEIEKFNNICRNKKLPEIKRINEKLEEMDYDNIYNEANININIGNDPVFNSMKERTPGDMNPRHLPKFSELTKGQQGFAIAGIVGAAILAFIFLSRNAIMFFYCLKNSLSKNLEYLGDNVEAQSIANEHDPTKSGKVSEKQKNLATKIRKLGKDLSDDFEEADYNSQNNLKKEDKMSTKEIEARSNPDNENNQYTNDDLFI